MKQIIHISPYDTGSINGLTNFSNSNAILKFLDPVDYYPILFSTLYQSGVNFIEVDKNSLPPQIVDNPFWEKKIIAYNKKSLENSIKKAIHVLDGRFYHDIDKQYKVHQYMRVLDYLSKFFYSIETGIPFINPEYITQEDFSILEPRMDKQLLSCLRNLGLCVIKEKVQTITPSYSALKRDVIRFEDIFNTKAYKNYSNSLQMLPHSSKLNLIKKEINVNSLKLFTKYGNDLNFKETAFSFFKFNKKLLEIFVSKLPSIVGDFVISSVENLTLEKKKIYFYEVNEAKYSTLLCNRIKEILKKEGMEGLGKINTELN